MKFLINKSYKALRQGQFVSATESAGEFILDTSDKDQFAFATLNEIAEKNGVSLKKGPKEEVVEKLELKLIKLNLPEQNRMSDTDTVNGIIADGVEAGLSDDDMLIKIVQAGIKFKNAGKLFKVAMEEGGYRISGAKRTEAINGKLEEAEFAPETYDEVQAMVETLVSDVADTSTVQAIKAIKKYLKALELEYPKAPKKPKGGLLSRFHKLVITNPALTVAELEDWLVENTSEAKVENYLKKYVPVLHFAQSVALSVSENEVDMSGVTLPAEEEESSED